MITDEKVARINELARKSRTAEGLTEAEKADQAELRREYVDAPACRGSWTTPQSLSRTGPGGS